MTNRTAARSGDVSSESLLAAFRALQLPIDPRRERDALKAFATVLIDSEIAIEDLALFVTAEFTRWMEGGVGAVDSRLELASKAALTASNEKWSNDFSRNYFKIHESLQEKRGLSPRDSNLLLSQLRIIVMSAEEGRMSSAKVAVVVGAAIPSLIIDWQEIQVVLDGLNIAPELVFEDADNARVRDIDKAERIFADADLDEASRIVSVAAGRLGFSGDLYALLTVLLGTEGQPTHVPYLQILYFQCLISEFFDNVPSALYEFRPRGQVLEKILEKVFGALAPKGNPVLNNAKGHAVLDRNWARARKPKELPQATALADIIAGLGELGQAAQRDLAGLLRCWVLRYIQLNQAEETKLPARLSEIQWRRVIAALGSGPSETLGIVEQRLVDAFARLRHREADGWRSRGIGDSVNATNTSRRKLGDCDFQNATARRVVAFEAHAGTLTPMYFRGHQRTLIASLVARVEEFESISERSEWHVRVVFVANEFGLNLPGPEDVDGVRVEYEFLRIQDALREIDVSDQEIRGVLEELVATPLRARRTPDSIRKRFMALADEATG